ncbi:glycosyltransferase family 2 protein [Sulfobacillus thermosulfidooxidans]|uniref:glycosyltransferase family 2 protein n=1 Tax=Sulfobacillus thermosulfidooxidans TaxID=28034 RepID=UPI001FA6E60C|nr:glycosyltransferase [Sulfobacillus thermosulfidooxidans]
MNFQDHCKELTRQTKLVISHPQLIQKIYYVYKRQGIQGLAQKIRERIIDRPNVEYMRWWKLQTPHNFRDSAITAMNSWSYKPKISIVMPTYNSVPLYLKLAITSVLNQVYPNWELCIFDDGSNLAYIRDMLEVFAKSDCRIKIAFSDVSQGIANATNRAIDMASGDFIGFLDHDDELTEDALWYVVKELQEKSWDIVYSDEDKIDFDGTFTEPFFKPDWSPEYLLSCNYITHFLIVRRALGDKVGWLREGFDGAQDYDLILRLSELSDKICHVPRILYHWRRSQSSTAGSSLAKPYAYEAGKRALAEAMLRRGINANINLAPNLWGHYQVHLEPHNLTVTIILDVSSSPFDMRRIIPWIEQLSINRFEIIIIGHEVEDINLTSVVYVRPHSSWTTNQNYAANIATGEILIFLDPNTKPTERSMDQLVSWALQSDIAGVGPKIVMNNRVVQAGLVLGLNGLLDSALRGWPQNSTTYFGVLQDLHNVSVISDKVFVTRKKLFQQFNGFDSHFTDAQLAVADYCLRAVSNHYRIVYHPVTVHYNPQHNVLNFQLNISDVSYFYTKWTKYIQNDPYYNPNLSRSKRGYMLCSRVGGFYNSVLHK